MSKLNFRYGQTSPTALGIRQNQGIWIRLLFSLDKRSLTPYYGVPPQRAFGRPFLVEAFNLSLVLIQPEKAIPRVGIRSSRRASKLLPKTNRVSSTSIQAESR